MSKKACSQTQMSAEEAGRLEERRRLCYVGMTRAVKLYTSLTLRCIGSAEQDKYHKPSRFIRELPKPVWMVRVNTGESPCEQWSL
ncbi:hypothetical protein OH492_01455 [Vibrio chagasii]|nr:hypothetical protein [Vibrio chagasii]